MSDKEETRGRPSTKHEPIEESFEEVLEILADSEYKSEEDIKKEESLQKNSD